MSTPPEHQATVLIVDDDRVHSRILRSRLEREGFHVVSSFSGNEGVKAALEYAPQVIVCDWLMEGMDGLEVCKQIKKNPKLSNIYFILLTSLSDVQNRVLGLDSGADDFLCKPVIGEELMARVRAGLRLHMANSRLAELAKALEKKQAQLNQELNEAAIYLRGQLPGSRLEGEIAIDYQFLPCQQLGGDCFDFRWLDDKHLFFYVLDVSGHGLAATLPSLTLLNNLRTAVHLNGLAQPEHLLEELNRCYPMSDENMKYFTIWCGIYNTTNQQLCYASAGHPPAVLISPNADIKVHTLATKGMAVGLFKDAVYHSDTCLIPAGSTLLVFSDGIYEDPRVGRDHDPLKDFVGSIPYDKVQREDWLEQIISLTKQRQGTKTFLDDVTLLRLRFRRLSPDRCPI
jgi:sigma-B regulation protein RsbU (phosphoserine phosphatase)